MPDKQNSLANQRPTVSQKRKPSVSKSWKKRNAVSSLERTITLVAGFGDLLMVVAGFLAAYWIRLASGWIPTLTILENNTIHEVALASPSLFSYLRLILLGWAVVLIGMLRENLYHYEYIQSPHKLLGKFLGLLLTAMAIFLGLTLTAKTDPPISRLFVLLATLLILILFYGWRLALCSVVRHSSLSEKLRRRVLVVGWSKYSARLRTAMNNRADSVWRYAGWIAVRRSSEQDTQKDCLGQINDLETIVHKNDIDLVAVADMDMSTDEVSNVANFCEREHVGFLMVPRSFEILISGLHARAIGNVPLLGIEALPLQNFGNQIVKRVVDIVGAIVGLMLSAPLMLIFGAIVFFESPGKVLYRQIRTGLHDRRFKIIKIRSMRLDAEANGAQWAKKDDDRRLRIGAFMRKWNIDEVPQFWNVLVGEMSLVGPRPERPELIEDFKYRIPHYNARHTCKPGMTGWAQVKGWRGDTDIEERIRHDIWYVENWNVWLDFKIMALTFVKQDNAY